jgi:3,4-dihydroxy 2-butanone 4-phosphate synthase/GTP cyclohydrolase II
MRQLTQHGMNVEELVPLLVGVASENEGYLEAKRDRMGHRLPEILTSDELLANLEGHPS